PPPTPDPMSMTVEQLRALLETIPGPARVCDASGTVVAENQAAHLLALTDDVKDEEKNYERAASLALESYEASYDLGDGWHLCKLVAPGGETSSTAGLSFGPAAQPTIHDLLKGITHELRNPLAAIITAIGLVQDDPHLAEETGMLLNIVKKESQRMNRILTEFSHYVRPPHSHLSVFCLARAARETIEALARDNILDAAVVVKDALPDCLMVRADEVQMRFVLHHIVQNAAEAMDQGGVLQLSSWAAPSEAAPPQTRPDGNPGNVVLCISDSGTGFSSEDLQSAFQPFYSTKLHATGLGLSVAHSAVSASGGRIWIENIVDNPTPHPGLNPGTRSAIKGARVCIELPSPPSTI
ncbi:MAG: HAMP domain-containing histidine kinase, partial [Armatimonadota bacterium]|nr:HAMP domain-containing histidine kinase [Armatimonadota bacterium]